MDSSLVAAGAAAHLGVPVSRVLRWCRDGTVQAHRDSRGRWMLREAELRTLAARHGTLPLPLPPGLTRNDVLILAALTRAPRGLPSARAAAHVARVAPTTASKSLDRLATYGLARRRDEDRIVRGRSMPARPWYADLDAPAVQELLPYLHRVDLPAPPESDTTRLPDHLWHLFWNADPGDIDPQRHAVIVAHRAMATGDPEAIGWAVSALPADAFDAAARIRGISQRSVAWARAARDTERRRVSA